MKRVVDGIEFDNDGMLSQEDIKKKLLSLKGLFDDMKSVKADNVKSFILKEVFGILAEIELTSDKLYELIRKANMQIDRALAALKKQESLHNLQIAKILESHCEEIKDIEEANEDKKVDEKLAKFSNHVGLNVEPNIPKEEQDCYAKWLDGQTLETAVDNDNETEPLTMDEILYGTVSESEKPHNKNKTGNKSVEQEFDDATYDDSDEEQGIFLTPKQFFSDTSESEHKQSSQKKTSKKTKTSQVKKASTKKEKVLKKPNVKTTRRK